MRKKVTTVGGEMLDRMLTRREQFALAALQGYASQMIPQTEGQLNGLARMAIRTADEMLAEIDAQVMDFTDPKETAPESAAQVDDERG